MKKGRIAAALLAVLTLFSVLMLSGCGERATLDFSQIVTVTRFKGVNGEGTAVIDADSNKALAMLGNLNEATANAILEDIEVIPQNDGSLSNGDKLTVVIKIDEQMLKNAKVKAKNTELTFDVSGLVTAIKTPAELNDKRLEELEKLAEGKLNEEIARLTNPEESQVGGGVSKNDIAKALTGSHSVDYGIDIKIPKIENVEFTAAYMYQIDRESEYGRYSFSDFDDYNTREGQFFTVMLFTADASFTAYREAGWFTSAIDLADTGKYVFAVRLKTPIIDLDGNAASEEIKLIGGGLSEQEIIAELNEDYYYSGYANGEKVK